MIDTVVTPAAQTVHPPAPWQDVSLAQWNDWRWQLSHRLNTVEDFARFMRLTPDEIAGLSAPDHFHPSCKKKNKACCRQVSKRESYLWSHSQSLVVPA